MGGGGISFIAMVGFNFLKFWESSQKFRKSHFVANSEISASVGTGNYKAICKNDNSISVAHEIKNS